MSNTLKQTLNKLFEKLGKTNGSAPKPSQVPLDAIVHEYNVASFGKTYWEKRRDEAKAKLEVELGPIAMRKLVSVKQKVDNTEMSQTLVIGEGQHHTVSAQVRIGASYLDEDELRGILREYINDDDINSCFKSARKRRAPNVTYIVAETNDGE